MVEPETFPVSLMLLAGMLCMFALAGALVIFFLIYTRRLAQQQLHIKQTELGIERQLLNNTLSTQEAERKRFARDLHDDVGGSLLTIMLNLAQLESRSEEDSYIQQQANQTHEQLNKVLQQLRQVSHNLVPPTLEEFGLLATLEDLVARIQESESVCLNMEQKGALPEMDYDTAIALYRMVKELLINALKHAKASTIHLLLEVKIDALVLTVKDDGLGYNVQDSRGGAGLQNLEARSRQIGASLQTETRLNKGTSTSISLPLIPLHDV